MTASRAFVALSLATDAYYCTVVVAANKTEDSQDTVPWGSGQSGAEERKANKLLDLFRVEDGRQIWRTGQSVEQIYKHINPQSREHRRPTTVDPYRLWKESWKSV